MSKFGDSLENRVTGERALVLRGDEDAGGLQAWVISSSSQAVAGELAGGLR